MTAPPIIVCIGSGGVGKTTTACALAIGHAMRGKKTLVLTIDPSQRLKSLLNLNQSGKITSIQDPRIEGRLDALIIDAKSTFDQFVLSAVQSPSKAEKIFKNTLYHQLSTHLSGSQEFTALETLLQASRSEKYDLIVLDTPPAGHAIEFLRAPQKLHSLFNEGITSWFRREKKTGLLNSVLNTGTQKVLQTLEMVTGSQFVHELRDFFNHIEDWQGQLESRTSEMHQLLISPQTHFWLVTNLDRPRLLESESLMKEIHKSGYSLRGIIINKVYPNWLPTLTEDQIKEENKDLASLYLKLRKYYSDKSLLIQSFSKHKLTLKIPELESAPTQFEELITLADRIHAGGLE